MVVGRGRPKCETRAHTSNPLLDKFSRISERKGYSCKFQASEQITDYGLSDRQIITVQQHSAESYAQQTADAFDWLAREARDSGGGRMLPLNVTPYILGLPYRIGAFERLIADLAARPEAWFARGDQIVDTWAAQSGNKLLEKYDGTMVGDHRFELWTR